MGTFKVNGDISATGTISASSFLGHASSATTARFLSSHDTRNDSIEPNQMKADEAVQFDFKADSTINLTDAPYSGVMSYRPYSSSSDWTGGPAHQLAFNSAGLYWRQSSGNTWLSWNKLIHSGNYTSYTVTKTGSGASGTWGINVTGSAAYATSASRLYSIDNSYKYGSANPYYGYLTYSDPYWDFKVSPATPADVRVSRAYTAGTADYATSASSASWATQAGSVYGPYSGNGGNQIPSYIGTNTTRFAMMRNFGSSDIGGYMDCILMNNYSWSDVPYATGLGITKVNGYPRAIIANGPKNSWAYTTELLTSYNYSWWCAPASHEHSYLVKTGESGGASHAAALANWFSTSKASIPRNCLISMYSSAYGNGSFCMGYFLPGYDNGPYGGFFVAHYDRAWYVQVNGGSFLQKQLITGGSSGYYGSSLPSAEYKGQVFYLLV